MDTTEVLVIINLILTALILLATLFYRHRP